MSVLISDVEERHLDYLQDESRMRGCAQKIAFPRNADEVRQVLDFSRKNRMPVTVQGARTGIAGAAVPAEGLILNMSKMDRITGLRQEGEHFFLEVEPGVLLNDLKEGLASKRFDTEGWTDGSKEALGNLQKGDIFRFLPDPTETTASIGGMFGCNAKGLSGYRYGRMSDYTEQITFVNADGHEWRIPRGRFLAEEAGCLLPDGFLLPGLPEKPPYPLTMTRGEDLIDLIAGSEGMLGVVTSLELRLEKEPAECWGILFFFEEQKEAARFAGQLVQETAEAWVTAAEFFDRAALDVVEQMKGRMTSLKGIPDIPSGRNAAVYMELEAENGEAAEGLLFDLLERFGECGGSEEDTWAASGLREMEKFRLLRHAVPEGINNRVDEIRRELPGFVKMGADFGGAGSNLEQIVERCSKDAAEACVRAVIFGHALDLHLHVNLLPGTEDEKKRADALMNRWADETAAAGGSLAEENGIGKVKAGLVCSRLPAEVLEAMRTAKNHFDRDGLLNRGNMGI